MAQLESPQMQTDHRRPSWLSFIGLLLYSNLAESFIKVISIGNLEKIG